MNDLVPTIATAYLTTLLADPRVKEEIARVVIVALSDSAGGSYIEASRNEPGMTVIDGCFSVDEVAQACLDALARMAGGKPL
jgi:hypothetical protein